MANKLKELILKVLIFEGEEQPWEAVCLEMDVQSFGKHCGGTSPEEALENLFQHINGSSFGLDKNANIDYIADKLYFKMWESIFSEKKQRFSLEEKQNDDFGSKIILCTRIYAVISKPDIRNRVTVRAMKLDAMSHCGFTKEKVGVKE